MTGRQFSIRYINYLLVFLALVTVCLVAQTKRDLFNEANKLYADGYYKEALAKYESILQSGYESGALYFNMGNSYYKLRAIGKAILYYEKAAKYIAGDEALEQNLAIARLQIVDKIEPIPRLRLTIWKEELLGLLSTNIIAWITFVIFMILSLVIAYYILVRKKAARRVGWIIFSIWILTLILFIAKINDLETKQYAIVLSPKIEVISEPSLGGTEVFVLHEGTKVRINRILDTYAEITLADGKTGWIKLDSLGMI
jgi:tetratricopeptide (TPR) repeat protein